MLHRQRKMKRRRRNEAYWNRYEREEGQREERGEAEIKEFLNKSWTRGARTRKKREGREREREKEVSYYKSASLQVKFIKSRLLASTKMQ